MTRGGQETPLPDRKDTVTSPEDKLYDIHNRPADWDLRFSMIIGLTIQTAAGAVVPFLILYWAGVRQWALIGIPFLCLIAALWLSVRYLKRRGAKVRALYAEHGGNTAGTSDMLFGQMTYSIEPDGRWKWPEPSSSTD